MKGFHWLSFSDHQTLHSTYSTTITNELDRTHTSFFLLKIVRLKPCEFSVPIDLNESRQLTIQFDLFTQQFRWFASNQLLLNKILFNLNGLQFFNVLPSVFLFENQLGVSNFPLSLTQYEPEVFFFICSYNSFWHLIVFSSSFCLHNFHILNNVRVCL